MQAVVKDMAEVLEHLVFSHTFRSEKTQQRVRALLQRIADGLAGLADQIDPPAPAGAPSPAPAEAPASQPERVPPATGDTAGDPVNG